jgi:hypothetical protein
VFDKCTQRAVTNLISLNSARAAIVKFPKHRCNLVVLTKQLGPHLALNVTCSISEEVLIQVALG